MASVAVRGEGVGSEPFIPRVGPAVPMKVNGGGQLSYQTFAQVLDERKVLGGVDPYDVVEALTDANEALRGENAATAVASLSSNRLIVAAARPHASIQVDGSTMPFSALTASVDCTEGVQRAIKDDQPQQEEREFRQPAGRSALKVQLPIPTVALTDASRESDMRRAVREYHSPRTQGSILAIGGAAYRLMQHITKEARTPQEATIGAQGILMLAGRAALS